MTERKIQREERSRGPIRSVILNPRVGTRAISIIAFMLGACFLFSSGTAGAAISPRHDGMRAAFAAGTAYRAGGARPGAHAQRRMHEHLPQWIREHGNLPLAEQERALRTQPGFDRLPTRKQQRLIHRLQQLDAMPPMRRERTLQRMEAMERLSPNQRRQVRHTMRDVLQMPPDQRQKMRRAFHQLTQLPPEQRQAVLSSQQFRSEFSDRQRQMLRTLMSVQPYTPPAQPTGAGAGPNGK